MKKKPRKPDTSKINIGTNESWNFFDVSKCFNFFQRERKVKFSMLNITTELFNLFYKEASSHGLVVKADGSWPIDHGFKARHRIWDGCKRWSKLLHLKKIENKGSQMGNFLTKIKNWKRFKKTTLTATTKKRKWGKTWTNNLQLSKIRYLIHFFQMIKS